MSPRRVLVRLVAVMVVLLATGCAPASEAPARAPELAGPGLAGGYHDLEELRGSVVVVSAWASWCAPCREELPVLARAQEQLGEHGLEVLGLNVRDRPESARRFLDEVGAALPSVLDPDGTISVHWGVRGMPETFVVDRGGNVVEHHFGAVTDDWVDGVLVPLVQS